MYKQSSGRNNRSKGFKIKHAIQLFVLVAICIWLIYQVKHSHDKKREFEEKNIKTTSSLSNGAGDEVIKFGRKDVQGRYEKTTLVTDGKVEEAEDEEAEGGGGDQEDNKNEEDEQEEDKHEEKEDEVRGGGDDEIDENDQHKYNMDLEQENLIDEKDAEGKDTEEEVEEERPERENLEEGERSEGENSEESEKSEKENSEEGESERENSGESQREREEEDHEAREEHYKADDASSAVAHETESESLEKLNENSGTEEESSNNVEEFSAQGNLTVGNDIHQNVFTVNETSSLNSTMKEEKNSELEEGHDPIEMSRENSDALLNQIQEDVGLLSVDGKKSDLKATNNSTTQLEEEQKPQVTSQNIVHESTSGVNTTNHSEVVESGKEDPNADSLLNDPIDSLDSSSSNLQESSSDAALHDHVGVDNDDIRRTMEGNSDEQDATVTM